MKKIYIIEKSKIINNIKIIKSKINVLIISVMKCNAYGLGLLEFANIISKNDINYFALSDINDIIYLRKKNFNNQIIYLNQTNNKNEIKKLIDNNTILTLGSLYSIILANQVAKTLNKKINAYIKLDIGMARYGFNIKDINIIKNIFNKINNINFIGICSHFSTAFSCNNKILQKQIKYLEKFIKILNSNNLLVNKKIIVANSFVALNIPKLHYSGVRIGSAFLGRTKCEYKLKKIGYLKTYIHEIKNIFPGQTIGYGALYIAKNKMKIAIIDLGHFDGFGLIKENIFQNKLKFLFYQIIKIIKNFISNEKYYVYISNKKYPIIGQIGMCHSFIDITNSNVNINDNIIVDISPLRINPNIKKIYV